MAIHATETITNSDKADILAGVFPYNSQGGWLNNQYVALDITFTYDTDTAGLTVRKTGICMRNFAVTSNPEYIHIGMYANVVGLAFNGNPNISNVKATVHYAKYDSNAGLFVEQTTDNTVTAITLGVTGPNSGTFYRYIYAPGQSTSGAIVGRFQAKSTLYYNNGVGVKVDLDGKSLSNSQASGAKALIAAAIDDYFYEEPSPSGDLEVNFDVWSQEGGTYQILASNLLNIPSGLLPASYQVMVNYDTNSWVDLKGYKSQSPFNLSWDRIYNALPADTDRATADSNGYIDLYLTICRTNPDATGGFDRDLAGRVRFYSDGRISDLTGDTTHVHVTLHQFETMYANGEYSDNSDDFDNQVPGQEMSVDNMLTTTYAVDETALKAFGRWLWANNLQPTIYEMQTSPIENIISCKRIPFEVPKDLAEERWTSIRLGNLDSEIGYDQGTQAYDGRVKIADTGHKQVIGEIKIPCYYNDFIDMTNKISIYLPYCGMQTIPTSSAYRQRKDDDGIPYIDGRKLRVEYYFDIVFGSCCAVLYIDNVMFASYNGTCGVDIPLTQSNRAYNELNVLRADANVATGSIVSAMQEAGGGAAAGAIAGSAVAPGFGTVLGAILGGFMSDVGGTIKNQTAQQFQELHYQTSGGFSSQIASFMPSDVTLIIEHTKYEEPKNFGHENGYPCNLAYNIGDLHGYTEIDGACELKGIPCFEQERKALKEALMQGFYID